MPTELSVIEAGLIIGEFDLETKKIFPNNLISISFTCLSSAHCCSKLIIPISDKDLLGIENQGYALNQIIDIQSPFLKLPIADTSDIEKYYWLKRKAYTNTCRFLTDDNLCEIYDFRPLGCRVFPFSIKHLSYNRVQIRVHIGNTCQSVKFNKNSDNKKILNNILETYSQDLKEKRDYFDRYGNDI